MPTTPRNPLIVAETYLATWNEADDARRRTRLREGWAPGATYRDPLMRAEGLEGIAGLIEGARRQFPGHRFVLSGRPDGHDDLVRFSWILATDGGPSVGGGTDVVRLDGDGRIVEVLGFLDGAPA